MLSSLATRQALRGSRDAGCKKADGAAYLTDAEYDGIVGAMLAQAAGGDLWLFGYSSLLWKREFAFAERQMAAVRGWHRAFCIRVARFRGTRDLNGVMMTLDRAGNAGA